MPPKKSKKMAGATAIRRANAKSPKAALDYDIDEAYEILDKGRKTGEQVDGSGGDLQEADAASEEADVDSGIFSYYLGLVDKCINLRHVFQLFMLFFLTNLMYLAFKEKEKEGVENAMDPMVTASCILLTALLESVAVLNSRFRQFEKKQTQVEPQLLDFDYVYAVFLPLAVAVLKVPQQVVVVACCVVQIGYMNLFVRLLVSYVILFQFGTGELALDGKTLLLPVTACFLYEVFNRLFAQGMPVYEKSFLSVLITSLSYFASLEECNVTLRIMQSLYLAFFVGIILASPILEVYKAQNEKSLKYSLLLGIYLLVFACGLIISDKLLLHNLKQFHFNWLVGFIAESPQRLHIFRLWAVSSAVLLPGVFVLCTTFGLPLCWKRKVWHFVLFAFTVKPLVLQPELVSIALFGLLGVLVIVEMLRANELPPFGGAIKALFAPFHDAKEQDGGVVLSYIYLILGVSLPLWVNNVDARHESSYIGLITLGLGDALASLVGSRCGHSKWPNSSKSVQGSIAMGVGVLAGYCVLDYATPHGAEMVVLNWTNRVMCAILCALFEGMVDVNDNLFVPVYGYVVEELLLAFNT